MPSAALSNRALILVSGKDANDFLQGLITTDLGSLAGGEAKPGALLTPQGKILFDFLVSRSETGLVIETAATQAEALLKRLTMYRLRAAADLELQSPAGVTISFGEDGADGITDSRFEKAGVRVLRRYTGEAADASEDDYHRLRVENGIAAAGFDYELQDAFPHDVLMDLNGSLSFRKGCYIGQEVVSRMQHRGTARRRIVIVEADGALPESGTQLSAGGKPIGALGTVSGSKALAVVRIDKAGAALAAGEPILAGDMPVRLTLPAWSGLSFPAEADEASA